MCAVSNTSGLAGIAHWMNTYLKLKGDDQFSKNSELVQELKKWVDTQYDDGRVTVLTDNELLTQIKIVADDLGVVVKGVNDK